MTNEIKDWADRVRDKVHASFRNQLSDGELSIIGTQEMLEEIGELRAKVESFTADAARYRWLRDSARDSPEEISPIVVMMDEGGAVIGDEIDCHGIRAEIFLDEAIDAAMAKEKI